MKSPGLDGLPLEFYQMFWSYVGHILVEIYNSAFENSLLPESLRTAVMSLMFRSGEKDMY
jgi:hypothetical protein